MYRSLIILMLTLASAHAVAQLVPNPDPSQTVAGGGVWTIPDWEAAWATKLDTGNLVTSPEAHGAAGTCAQDDTAALQAALNAVAGIGGYVRALGCYQISADVSVPAGVSLVGNFQPGVDETNFNWGSAGSRIVATTGNGLRLNTGASVRGMVLISGAVTLPINSLRTALNVAAAMHVGGSVSAFTVTGGGTGYSAAPTITVVGGECTATGTATVSSGVIQSIAVSVAGADCPVNSQVVITDSTGTRAAATATVTGGAGTAIASPAGEADDVHLHDLMILGFHTCISANYMARLRLSNVHGDCDEGLVAQNLYDTPTIVTARFHSYLVPAGPSSTYVPDFPISGIASASGLIQLTIPITGFALQNGDPIVVSQAPSATNANGFWTVSNVNAAAGTFTLVGSTYAAAGSGGQVSVNSYMRWGPGFWIENVTGITMYDTWSFGHRIGLYAGNGATWLKDFAFGVDNVETDTAGAQINDPGSIGVWVDGSAQWLSFTGGSFSSQGTAWQQTSTARGTNSLLGVMLATNAAGVTGNLINISGGALDVMGGEVLNGTIAVGSAVAHFGFCADGAGTTVSASGLSGNQALAICPVANLAGGMGAQFFVDSSANTGLKLNNVNTWAFRSLANGNFDIINLTNGLEPLWGNNAGVNSNFPLYMNAHGIVNAGNLSTGGTLFAGRTITAIATAGNATITAAQLAGTAILRTGAPGAFTDTTDTAANYAGLIAQPQIGVGTVLRIANETAYTETLAGGAGVTISGAATVSPNSWRDYIVQLTATATPALLMTSIGSGTL